MLSLKKNLVFAPETLLDYKPADLSMPFKDAVLKLDCKLHDFTLN